MLHLSRFQQEESQRNLRRAVAVLTAAIHQMGWLTPSPYSEPRCEH